MKNLFGNKRELEIIEAIHNEFDSAQERLLKEALDVLAKDVSVMTIPIADRLEKIGFINTPAVLENKKLLDKKRTIEIEKVTNREQAELIQYYQQAYPFLKFLTENELERICKKYQLIHAPVANFIGNVPEKNVRDIENAQALKQEDIDEEVFELHPSYDVSGFENLMQLIGHPDRKFTQKQINNLCIKYYGYNVIEWTDKGVNDTWLWAVKSKLESTTPLQLSSSYDKVTSLNRKDRLFICAPQKDFNLEGLKKTKSGWFNVFETEVKDPIVYRYVRGGVQVITKWGLEAEDPSLVVPQLN